MHTKLVRNKFNRRYALKNLCRYHIPLKYSHILRVYPKCKIFYQKIFC
jgi:hypothetical protein